MTTRVGAALVGPVVFVAVSCGATYIDDDVAVPDDTASTTTLAPVPADAPVTELLAEIEERLSDLDERIIDERGHVEALARIDELWSVAEPQIRAADPDDVFNFEQAIELARSGVERRRPADASKGYKIMGELLDDRGRR